MKRSFDQFLKLILLVPIFLFLLLIYNSHVNDLVLHILRFSFFLSFLRFQVSLLQYFISCSRQLRLVSIFSLILLKLVKCLLLAPLFIKHTVGIQLGESIAALIITCTNSSGFLRNSLS